MHRMIPALILLSVVLTSTEARADINRWEYVNPADPSQGKKQSTTLVPDGAGVDGSPDANLATRNLTMAYFIGADLTNAEFSFANLSDADFTGAVIRGANLTSNREGGFTAAQLYSTASYQSRDLTGIRLRYRELSGWNLARLDLRGVDFAYSALAGADFTGADVRGANFGASSLTLQQVYSTASYQAGDLRDMVLGSPGGFFDGDDSFPDANFAGMNLTNINLRHASLPDADLSRADLRGAEVIHGGFYVDASALEGVELSNAIHPDGRIDGLDLGTGQTLIIRDYDGATFREVCGFCQPPHGPIPITVDSQFTITAGGALRMIFEADEWDSTISFIAGIPVTLGGTLELTFADGVDLASQIGRTFDLFNWDGVSPTGAFAVSSPYRWDLTNLYTTGEVTLTAIPEPQTAVLLLTFLIGAVCLIPRRLGATQKQLLNPVGYSANFARAIVHLRDCPI